MRAAIMTGVAAVVTVEARVAAEDQPVRVGIPPRCPRHDGGGVGVEPLTREQLSEICSEVSWAIKHGARERDAVEGADDAWEVGVGTGPWARLAHGPGLLAADDVELVGVWGRTADRATTDLLIL